MSSVATDDRENGFVEDVHMLFAWAPLEAGHSTHFKFKVPAYHRTFIFLIIIGPWFTHSKRERINEILPTSSHY